MIQTKYPKHPQLNVSYRYDSVGRIAKRTDLTGSITYQYDELGNIKQEDRHIILPNEEKTYNFETRYEYDMLGRMKSITYPDSEKVDYTYQLGQLTTIQGDNQSLAQEMKYDEYDHLTQMKHGNGYTTSYNYDTNRQWLKNSRTSNIYTSIGKRSILRDASYSYDRVGNIVAIQEYSEAYQPDGKTAITIPQIERDFSYDANNRLIHSSSTQQLVYGGGLMLPVYDYNITYSPSGMIASKTTTLNGVKTDLTYGYNVPLLRGQGGFTGFEGVSPSLTGGEDGSSAQTTWDVGVSPSTDAVRNHQINTIASEEDTTKLTWDADGQLTQMQRCRGVGVSPASNNDGEATVLSTRTHLWNENGQMALFISDGGAGYYGYDANGERVYKLTGYTYKDNYNAGEETTKVMLNDVVLYVNPYFIVTPKGYTKHYYNGSNRLASVVGDVSALSDSIVTTGGADGSSAQTMSSPSQRKSEEYMRTIANGDTLMKVQVYAEENMLYPVLSKEVKSQEDYNVKDNTYYYHADHLGSCSWITDGSGDIIEHRRYLPYGEEWYHKKFNVSDYTERYKFTGKERDEESGYDYFGARYYDSRLLTSWLSVDPLAGKYPYQNPYTYCENNPLKYIDPDGRKVKMVVSGNTITFSGNYYAKPKDEVSLNKAVDFWNKQSNLTYMSKEGNKYNVKFELTAISNSVAPREDAKNDEYGNSYEVVDFIISTKTGYSVNGRTADDKNIQVTESKKDGLTGAHEVGHTMMETKRGGVEHSQMGVMTALGNDPNRNNNESQESVNTIVESHGGVKTSIWQKIKSIFE